MDYIRIIQIFCIINLNQLKKQVKKERYLHSLDNKQIKK